jgi:hypothetical protein
MLGREKSEEFRVRRGETQKHCGEKNWITSVKGWPERLTKTTKCLFPCRDEYRPKFPHVLFNVGFVPARKVVESALCDVPEASMFSGLDMNLASP